MINGLREYEKSTLKVKRKDSIITRAFQGMANVMYIRNGVQPRTRRLIDTELANIDFPSIKNDEISRNTVHEMSPQDLRCPDKKTGHSTPSYAPKIFI